MVLAFLSSWHMLPCPGCHDRLGFPILISPLTVLATPVFPEPLIFATLKTHQYGLSFVFPPRFKFLEVMGRSSWRVHPEALFQVEGTKLMLNRYFEGAFWVLLRKRHKPLSDRGRRAVHLNKNARAILMCQIHRDEWGHCPNISEGWRLQTLSVQMSVYGAWERWGTLDLHWDFWKIF